MVEEDHWSAKVCIVNRCESEISLTEGCVVGFSRKETDCYEGIVYALLLFDLDIARTKRGGRYN